VDDHAARAGSASAASGLSVVQPSLEGTLETWPGVPEGGYNRVLLKLSGEAFAGGGSLGVDPDVVQAIARQIAGVVRSGTEVAVVIGGGNFFRGAELNERGMDRSRADYMGMLGTVMNCLALQDFCDRQGIETRVQTAIQMGQVAEPYVPRRAIRHLEKGRVVIFGAGLGAPYFSTDTTAAQRALECGAEVVLMAKGVDGVYDDDPRTNPDAVRFETLSHDEVLARNLKVADSTAISLCRDNALPIIVFNLLVEGNIARAVRGERIGTLVAT
jgi:uridylate kinase